MYDLHTHVHFEGEADKVRTWDEDDYECTETSTYRILRDFDVDYDKIPVDASKVMPDKMMDLMEPYKYGELGDFDAKYLSGFQAEVYDEDKNTLLPRAKKKADKYSQKYLSSYNVEYDAVRPTVNDKKSTEKESFYSFLPVWRYVYRYQGKNYEFYVNGQTGRRSTDKYRKDYRMVYRRVWFPFLHCGNVALFIGGVINGKDIPWNINICCYTWNCDGTGRQKV